MVGDKTPDGIKAEAWGPRAELRVRRAWDGRGGEAVYHRQLRLLDADFVQKPCTISQSLDCTLTVRGSPAGELEPPRRMDKKFPVSATKD